MQYIINNAINSDELDKIRGMSGKILDKILVNEIGDMYLEVVLIFNDKKISIKNQPTIQNDEDEYPKFVIEDWEDNSTKYNIVTSDEYIKNIMIIQDNVQWNYNENKWCVINDIGIKIILTTRIITLIAKDSLAGFIKMYVSSIDEMIDLDDYWEMKTDRLDYLERKVL